MTKADNAVVRHITANHALAQTRLVRLIDDASGTLEVGGAPLNEIAERHLLKLASAQCVQHLNRALS